MNNILDIRTRSSQNWSNLPGNFDVLHVSKIFESDNEFGIPTILKQDFIPKDLVMYGAEVRQNQASARGRTVHFFLDDYKFEPLWNKPNKTLTVIQRQGSALSPDFSLFSDYPLAVQMWNTYRSRWLARFWQENEVLVIPTISWSDEASYDFCFSGIEKHSTLAISTVGLRGKESKRVFKFGFEEMMKRLEPKSLIVYGENDPVPFEEYTEVHRYETYWKKKRGVLSGR
jgi:hypothetical protein